MIAKQITSCSRNILQQLQNWARCNCMSIYPVKTEIVFVSKMPFMGPFLPITQENNSINCVSHSLGVTLENKLCWSTHIISITANFNAKLNKLKQMKTFDHTTLETIYLKVY